MASVRIVVYSSIAGNVEAEQESLYSWSTVSDEKNEIRDLLVKATENIYGAYGITDD